MCSITHCLLAALSRFLDLTLCRKQLLVELSLVSDALSYLVSLSRVPILSALSGVLCAIAALHDGELSVCHGVVLLF